MQADRQRGKSDVEMDDWMDRWVVWMDGRMDGRRD
jgi:hypothetical protein